MREYKKQLSKCLEFINFKCEPLKQNIKDCYVVLTAHGYHLITAPFNIEKFSNQFSDIDVHKNNPTLLYFECLE